MICNYLIVICYNYLVLPNVNFQTLSLPMLIRGLGVRENLLGSSPYLFLLFIYTIQLKIKFHQTLKNYIF